MNKTMTAGQFSNAMVKYSNIQPYCAPDFSNQFVLEFWFEELGHYEIAVLGRAMKTLCIKNRFPCVHDIKTECGDVVISDDALGRETAERIWAAIGKYGSRGWENAQKHIGEIGERVIGGSSGWMMICETATNSNAGIFKAQWREAAKGQMEMARAGFSGAPKLPPMNENVKALAAKTAQGMRLLGDSK